MLRRGRTSLAIGVTFLVLFLLLGNVAQIATLAFV
jgi:hypothetical protein